MLSARLACYAELETFRFYDEYDYEYEISSARAWTMQRHFGGKTW